MSEITKFFHETKYTFRNSGPLEGYIYENVCSQNLYNQLKKNITGILNNTTKNTFLTHGTTVHHEGVSTKLVSHKQNDREQNVIYDLSFDSEWYYQTVDTIKEWSTNKLYRNLSPVFLQYFHTIQNLEPFATDINDYILYRLHLNYLPQNELLALHTDTALNLAKSSVVSYNDCRVRSLTFYLYDHVENYGGEFWAINGFVYKPKQNSALLILNGHNCFHGVTANMLDYPRLAFTVRMYHKEDLYLPGHPDKFLYKLS